MRAVALLILLGISSISCAKKYITPEIYLVPDGYIGALYIIYDVETGQPKRFDEQGARLYEFTDTGILLTQFSDDNEGHANHDLKQFYYVDENNNRKRIPLIFGMIEKTDATLSDPTVYAQLGGGGSHGYSSEVPCKYAHNRFYVASAKQTYNREEGMTSYYDYYDKYGFPCGKKLYFDDKPPIDIQ